MKMILTDDEIEFLEAMNRLSPENRARIDRLIDSWIKRDKEKRSINNVIPIARKSECSTEEDIMNEVTAKNDFDWASVEGDFNHHHLIAKGVAELLFRASEVEEDLLSNEQINGAAYSINCSIKKMDEMHEKLYLENIYIDMDMYDEFSDQYALGKSNAGLLFYISQSINESIESFVVNPVAYGIQSSLKEMNCLFQTELKAYLIAKKAATANQ